MQTQFQNATVRPWKLTNEACWHGSQVGFSITGPLTSNRRIDVRLAGTPDQARKLSSFILTAVNEYDALCSVVEKASEILSSFKISPKLTEQELSIMACGDFMARSDMARIDYTPNPTPFRDNAHALKSQLGKLSDAINALAAIRKG